MCPIEKLQCIALKKSTGHNVPHSSHFEIVFCGIGLDSCVLSCYMSASIFFPSIFAVWLWRDWVPLGKSWILCFFIADKLRLAEC